jgi:capsular exopolysaccharide synthesis family protein
MAFKDASPVRIEDILNTLIDVYNEETINDKNRVAINTADFINERLIIIENELGGVEDRIEKFKQDNKILSIGDAAGQYMGQSQRYTGEEVELETQLRIVNYVKEYLTDPAKETELIPTNTGVGDAKIEGLITQYNNMKMRRDKYIEISSEKNPVVQELNNNMRATKQTIVRTIDNLIVGINVRLKDARSQLNRADARLASIPTKEREMLSIERQQKIKESLYMFLLNRREENALSQAMADNNARVIDTAEAGYSPISPNRNRILLMGGLVGFAVPAVIFLMIMFLDTRVHSRKDMEGVVTMPYLGEIPIDKALTSRKKRGKRDFEAAVKADGDDVISEAFRIVRTNISMMLKKSAGHKVITFTSFHVAAGKTFIARNLAMSLAHANKKVILVDLDIRKHTLSRLTRAAKHGISDYIVDENVTPADIIQSCNDGHGVDIISAGTTAPNPAELLLDKRLDELFVLLREKYDYVIVDNVPVGIVADGDITNRLSDMTVFVVRAGRLDKRQLPDLEQMYKQQKFTNMSLVLNGADLERRAYGYGYGYGYGYSYGYGYGYGYGAKKKKKSGKKA